MKSRFILLLFFFFALRLAAQDVTVTGLSWVDPHDPSDTLPVAKISAPDYPDRLRGSTEIGYAVIDVSVDSKGKELAMLRAVTDPLFEEAIQNEEENRHFKPARREDKPINSLVRFTILFNPVCADKDKSDATPRLLNLILPELPAKLYRKDAPPTKLYVTASIDATGHVTKAAADVGSSDALGQAAEDAVLKWTFAPARKDGQPVAQEVRVPVLFMEPLEVNAEADIPPRVIQEVKPVYPRELRKAGLRGEVKMGFVVDIEGRVRDPVVLSSTNAALNQPTIDALLKWRFEPGKRNGVPVNTRMMLPMAFLLDATPNGGEEPYQVDESGSGVPPKPANTVFAVYPFELLRDHVEGSAEIKFLVAPDGSVAQAEVVTASRPEFGLALVAMIDEWKFQPARKDGKPIWASMTTKQYFLFPIVSALPEFMPQSPPPVTSDVPLSDTTLDLLQKLKKGKLDACPIKELDAKPQLLARQPPVFPSSLIGKMSKGEAVVEFLIDHDGNVQLPRIVSATDPAFGYAAVQGVSAWKFSPPTSHGKAVVIRVQVPVRFSAPAAKPAPAAAATPAQN